MKFNDHSTDTHNSLIECAKLDDKLAWDKIFALYSPLIKFWAQQEGVQDKHEIENVCQEVLARMFNSLSTFSKPNGRGSFRGWIRVITRNYIVTKRMGKSPIIIGGSAWHRRMNEYAITAKGEDELLDSVSTHHAPEEKSFVFRKIMNWVEQEYSEEKNQMFRSVVIDQRPPKDVAKDFNVSTNVVYQNKSRILARIRAVYKDLF